jgi:hypothetical protein
MRMAFTFAFALLAGISGATASDTGAVVVIPSRAGVPIMINGVDASYAVVEGDWGLGKSVSPEPVVYGGWPAALPRPSGRYFPRTGKRPGYGRYEVNTPPRSLPGDGSYYRSWSAESPRGYGQDMVPSDPPPIIYAPQYAPRFRGPRPGPGQP